MIIDNVTFTVIRLFHSFQNVSMLHFFIFSFTDSLWHISSWCCYIIFYMSFDLFPSLGIYRAVTKIQVQLTSGVRNLFHFSMKFKISQPKPVKIWQNYISTFLLNMQHSVFGFLINNVLFEKQTKVLFKKFWKTFLNLLFGITPKWLKFNC